MSLQTEDCSELLPETGGHYLVRDSGSHRRLVGDRSGRMEVYQRRSETERSSGPSSFLFTRRGRDEPRGRRPENGRTDPGRGPGILGSS